MTASYNLSQLGSNYLQGGSGSVARTTASKLQESVSVRDFGAVGDGTTDDTAAIAAAVLATGYGDTLYFPAGTYKISSEIRLTKPITILGAGPNTPFTGVSGATFSGSYIYQSNTAANAFTLVAALTNYTFSQYGITGVHFRDICLTGALTNVATRAVNGIGVDTSINSGNFHIRNNSITNCTIKFFTTGVNFVGIAYLNNFFDTVIQYCTTGFSATKGAASTAGGQTRFFGCTIDGCTTAISWFTDSLTGSDLYISGCTIADGSYGISTMSESPLTVIGSHFESLKSAGSGYAIYVYTPAGQSGSEGPKYIVGNNFSDNDVSIIFDFTSSAYFTGAFVPVYIDCNVGFDPVFLKVLPKASTNVNTNGFVLGASNVGLSSGQLTAAQVVSFAGLDLRKQRITRRYVFGATYASGTAAIFVPPGFIPLTVRMYLTANASAFTSLNINDLSISYVSGINGNTQALNTWLSWTPVVPQAAVSTYFSIIGTAGMLGAQGVLEIDGYVP